MQPSTRDRARSDPAVVLLHGQPGSARDWVFVQRALGERARAIAVDRPGWNGRGSTSDLAGNARAALAALDAAQVELATVVGHSLGSAVAAWLAAERPDRVSALVLAAPSANMASLNRLDRLLATPLLGAALGAGAMAGVGAALATQPLRRRIARRLALDPDYLRTSARALLTPSTWRAFATEQRMLIRDLPALEERLSQISAPTTIVIGTSDRIVSPSSARRLAAGIRRAEVVQIARATHLLPQQRPRELAGIIVTAATHGR